MKRGETCSAARQPPRINRVLPRLIISPTPAAPSDENRPYSVSLVDSRDILQDQLLCNELVDLYFDLMHDKQHALFHRPSFISRQRSGQAPVFIVLAMMAIVARFSQNLVFESATIHERGSQWAKQSRKLFDERHPAVSLVAVQGCALLANLAFIQGDSARESLYGAQQIRMVQLLGYPRSLSADRIQREVEIRGTHTFRV